MSSHLTERRLALIHRVIVPDQKYPTEYAILVTDSRSVFIRQKKTRSSYWLRGEMKFGTALVTDVIPKTHEAVVSLVMGKEEPEFRAREFFVWLTMRRQGHRFQVYNFEMKYRQSPNAEPSIKFYMVPLGAYFKPERQTKSRETILREYAIEALEMFQKVLPAGIASS